MLLAAAGAHRGTLELEIAPLLPAIMGDRARLQEAFATLLRGAEEGASAGSRVRIVVDRADWAIRITITEVATVPASVRWVAAVQMIHAHGGVVERRADGLSIELPVDDMR